MHKYVEYTVIFPSIRFLPLNQKCPVMQMSARVCLKMFSEKQASQFMRHLHRIISHDGLWNLNLAQKSRKCGDAQMAGIIFQTRSEACRQQKFFLRHIPNPNDQEVTQ